MTRRALVAAVLMGVVAMTSCGDGDAEAPARPPASPQNAEAGTPTATGAVRGAERPSEEPRTEPQVEHVIAISVDGLAVAAIERLGPSGAPTMHALLEGGVGTLNARTAYEANNTLPNHVGMVTGRIIDESAGGHGVTWNVDRPHDTVPAASGGLRIKSIFSVAHEAGMSTALFAGKDKFDILPDSWPSAIDHVDIRDHDPGPDALARAVAAYFSRAQPNLTFWHIASPDEAGHRFGGMSQRYMAAVRAVDTAIGNLVALVRSDEQLRERTVLVLTADHGVSPGERAHSLKIPAHYTVPFVVWGAGVGSGNLYSLNPRLADPGTQQPAYAGAQPVRNFHMAAVVLDALGLAHGSGPRVLGEPLRVR